MGAAFGLGFVIGPAIGGLLGTVGTRVPFFVAAAISIINLVFGYFVLPESLAPVQRRAFELSRANPIGTFKVFTTYKGVLPMCGVMFIYFFATAIYPAIWPFWGIAKFGWSELTIGITLAAFGLINAAFQGGVTGWAVKRIGEWNLAFLGLVTAVVAMMGYGLAFNFTLVLILLVVHGPEGFVYPMLTSLISKEVPADAQGEMQGGLASAQSLAMLLGTVVFSQMFGYFLLPTSPIISPNIAFFVAAACLAVALGWFVLGARKVQTA
jgi:DHA1 family tetracycline resistance protein-like MFS transporter